MPTDNLDNFKDQGPAVGSAVAPSKIGEAALAFEVLEALPRRGGWTLHLFAPVLSRALPKYITHVTLKKSPACEPESDKNRFANVHLMDVPDECLRNETTTPRDHSLPYGALPLSPTFGLAATFPLSLPHLLLGPQPLPWICHLQHQSKPFEHQQNLSGASTSCRIFGWCSKVDPGGWTSLTTFDTNQN